MSSPDPARVRRENAEPSGHRRGDLRVVPFPESESVQAATADTNFWQAVEADDKRRTRRQSGYWILAVLAHLAIGAAFLITLNQPDETPIEEAAIEMVAPPAPPHVEPPPPKPVEVKEAPKPKQVVVQRPIPKPVPRVDPPSPHAIPVPTVPPTPQEPPPPPPSQAAPPSYLGELYAHLAANKRYPRAAQLARVQGTALLRFTMNHQGQVLTYRIDRSSGHADLDAEVLAMIQRAQPLPKPPADMPEPWELTIPVQFSVR
jgi:protein TonB